MMKVNMYSIDLIHICSDEKTTAMYFNFPTTGNVINMLTFHPCAWAILDAFLLIGVTFKFCSSVEVFLMVLSKPHNIPEAAP